MAAARNRLRYDSELESNSSDEDYDYYPQQKYSKSANGKKSIANNAAHSERNRLPTRVPTVFNRNAVMARENRIKKKQYVDNLEKDIDRIRDQNIKLNSIMNNQSFVIAELKRELKYVKSALANSHDITKLLASIQRNTGMSVNSSLFSETVPIKSEYVSNTDTSKEKHPWEEDTLKSYPSFPTPDSPDDMFNLDLPFSESELMNLPLSDDFPLLEFENSPTEVIEPSKMHLREHNYTSSKDDETEEAENVGICLHVSNHRVSLEFCSSCNNNALNNWNRDV